MIIRLEIDLIWESIGKRAWRRMMALGILTGIGSNSLCWRGIKICGRASGTRRITAIGSWWSIQLWLTSGWWDSYLPIRILSVRLNRCLLIKMDIVRFILRLRETWTRSQEFWSIKVKSRSLTCPPNTQIHPQWQLCTLPFKSSIWPWFSSSSMTFSRISTLIFWTVIWTPHSIMHHRAKIVHYRGCIMHHRGCIMHHLGCILLSL